MGFEKVYDYVPGKVDWMAHGLPTEGEQASVPKVGAVVRGDVVTCGLAERVADVRPRVEASPYGFAMVLSDAGILLGRLRRSALDGDPKQPAAQAMEAGPSTVRPDTAQVELRERLKKRDLTTAVVTTPEGTLLGVVRAADLDP